jgi:epsilon-lactone hydrolase
MSPEMKAIKAFFLLRKKLGLANFGRKAKSAAKPTKSILKNTNFTSSHEFGFELNEVTPTEGYDKVLVYLHGGGYVNPIAKQHWQLIEQLAVVGRARVLVPRYGLAPHHDVAEALVFIGMVAEYAREFGKELVFAGDSAGGGLAVSALQHLGDSTKVSKLILISPWLNSEFSHPSLPEVLKHDPWLNPESLRRIAAVWSGEGNHQDQRVSPLRGDLSGLPRTLMFMGTWDVLLFDARWFYEKALASGVEISYEELDSALHVYPILPTPEGANARNKVLEFLAS